jgi:hypothetical protein
MFRALARGCPPGPFPGWCDATWATYRPAVPPPSRACLPVTGPPPATFQPGMCYTFGPQSWWTPLHFAAALGIGLAFGTLIGLIVVAFRGGGRCRCSGWPHVPWCQRSRKARA